MENTGLKGLAVTLYQRVILSYKSTILGILVVALGVLADNFVHSPNKVLTIVGSILGSVCIFLKERYPAPPDSNVVKGLILALVFGAAGAQAQERALPPTATTILCFDAAQLYCLRPGVGFSGIGYNFNTKTVAKDVVFAGLVELTLGHRVAVLAGGGFQTGEAQGLAVQAGVEYLPINVAVLYSVIIAGDTPQHSLNAGYVVRF